MADNGEEGNVDPDTITLRVKDQTGDEMFFKVKKGTKMQKIMDAFAGRKGITATSLRFTVDGERIAPDQTPKMLELEENDQIDVMLEMVGGGENDEEPAAEGGVDTITLRVRDQTGDEMLFKVKKATKMQKIFDAYASKRGMPTSSLRFMLDGERIKGDQTPKMMELEENDQVDVMLETVGGV
mmetsp:Transcript_6484/g.6630  ORF Transcript_6484/g.6630 Transcript_6484/m.6630 type:complete len:183 (+) Transcript_6484:63-611(+)|eukprot:CAMPEP_0119034992 /NCGR_PEP_ID=MMETSP1177-20130426/1982_1 /TAXON_ID=2985 /ORGANISM="Ochromonas sp, Strain CCMP1899" /LENGTH=182 /DNA_ID=CAMNT_0006992841 /DNA_START=51 /DNA_END=599 /DNA_ORIENTATION=+